MPMGQYVVTIDTVDIPVAVHVMQVTPIAAIDSGIVRRIIEMPMGIASRHILTRLLRQPGRN